MRLFFKVFLLTFRLEINAVVLLFFAFVIAFHQRNHINKIGVVSVYVAELDLNQTFYHLLSFA